MTELVGLHDVNEELTRRGGRILAISTDPPKKSREVVQKRALGFHIVADESRAVLSAFGLVHKGMGPGGTDVARPAMILLAKGGRIAWRRAAQRIQDRPPPAEVLAAVRSLD